MADLFYFCMLGFFLTHELDAMKRHEWRVLPLTSFLPDHLGELVFIWAHVPIIAGLFFFGGLDAGSTTALGLSIFGIIHVFLHIAFRNHPHYEFNNLSSWLLIIGTGIFGALHLVAFGLDG